MKLYVTLITKNVDSNNNVATSNIDLQIQKNAHFTLDASKEYDSFDFQVVQDSKLNINPFDIVNLEIYNDVELLETHSFQVINVIERTINNQLTTYEYTVNCTELTKRLERYFITRDFSQPTVNNLEILPYEGYTNRLAMVEECKEFCYFLKDSDKKFITIIPYQSIDSDTIELLGQQFNTDEIPSLTFSNDTLKDAFDEIFAGVNASPRLIYRINADGSGSIVLKAQFENRVTNYVNLIPSNQKRELRSINGYGTYANPEIQNIIGTDNLASNGLGRSFLPQDTFYDTSTAKIEVDYPIKEVVHLYISKFDNSIILGNDTEIDIAKNVIYSSQKEFLETLTNSDYDIGLMKNGLYKNNTVSFNEGTYEITGFGSEFEGNPLPFITNKKTVWEYLLLSYNIPTTSSNVNIQNWKYRIEYKTITTEKVEIFKNDFSEQKYLSAIPIQPLGQTIDFKKATSTLQDMIEKSGGYLEERTIMVDSNDNLELGANYYALNSVDVVSGKKITKKDCTAINGNLIVIYTLTKEEGYLNAFNGVDSLKRESAITQGVNRDIIVNEFVNIGFKREEYSTASSITKNGLIKFLETFKNTASIINGKVNNGVLIAEDLNYKLISVPMIKNVGKDYAKVGFRAKNPTNLGFKRTTVNNKEEKTAVNYTMLNGVGKKYGLVYGISEAKVNNIDFNKNLPEIKRELITGVDAIEGTNLIELGNVTPLEFDFELGAKWYVRKQFSESSAFGFPPPITYNETFTFEEYHYPNAMNFDLKVDSFNFDKQFELSFIIRADNVIIYEKIIDGSGLVTKFEGITAYRTLDEFVNFEQTLKYKNLSFELYSKIEVTFVSTFEISFNYISNEELIIPSGDNPKTDLTIKKNPSEILGIFHSLNAIKDKRIITGQALFTKNGLYTDERFKDFKLYLHPNYYYESGINNWSEQYGLTLNIGTYNDIKTAYVYFGEPSNFELYKSYSVFGVNADGSENFLFAVNAEYGKMLSDNESMIYFNFSAEAKGLIIE